MATCTSGMRSNNNIGLIYWFMSALCIQYMLYFLPQVNSHMTHVYTPDDIFNIVEKSCFIGISVVANGETRYMFDKIQTSFTDEANVLVGNVDFQRFTWSSGKNLKLDSDDPEIVLFQKRTVDRTCLLTGLGKSEPKSVVYNGATDNIHTLLDFINSQCNTYRTASGHLSIQGIHRKDILENLFYVRNVSDISIRELYYSHKDHPHTCSGESCSHEQHEQEDVINSYSSSSDHIDNHHSQSHDHYLKNKKMHQCDKVPLSSLSKEHFFHNYLKTSKPVIITGAMDSWKATSKWTKQFFRDKYGNQKVHIKLTPDAEFEGVTSANLFNDYNTFEIPKAVVDQLKFPDLVVVRPATANMKFSQFLDEIESVSTGRRKGYSAYLEYSSIASLYPELAEDTEEMPFFKKMLKLEHSNLWMSDGNTLGKLHFDPFDNFLCQISGKKEVILFEPYDNTYLYEAHIPEAMLSYNPEDGTFRRGMLMDSTSMVMSPVDILKPDIQRFPKFLDTFPMNCTIAEGEVLFMPSFWWHEVQSYPSVTEGRNVAVNFWYEPFLTREFPCEDCKLDVNPKYRHLL